MCKAGREEVCLPELDSFLQDYFRQRQDRRGREELLEIVAFLHGQPVVSQYLNVTHGGYSG